MFSCDYLFCFLGKRFFARISTFPAHGDPRKCLYQYYNTSCSLSNVIVWRDSLCRSKKRVVMRENVSSSSLFSSKSFVD